MVLHSIINLEQQWLSSLWFCDAIWLHGSKSTWVQVMACCLTASSHYLNQCWPITDRVLWNSFVSSFMDVLRISIFKMSLKIALLKSLVHPSDRGQWVNGLMPDLHQAIVRTNVDYWSEGHTRIHPSYFFFTALTKEFSHEIELKICL